MPSFGVNDKLPRDSRLWKDSLHGIDLCQRDAAILGTIKSQYRCFELGCDIEWLCWCESSSVAIQASVPRSPRLETGSVCARKPDNASAPAESCDPSLLCIRLLLLANPVHQRIDIRHHLCIRYFGDDIRHDGAHRGLGSIPLALIQIWGDGIKSELCKAAADILNMLMQPEDFLDDDDDGSFFCTFWMCNVDIHFDVIRALEGLHAGIEAIRACLHIGCFHRGNCECKPGANQSGNQCPS